MKHIHLISVALIALFTSSCSDPSSKAQQSETATHFIPLDSANKMIESYITSTANLPDTSLKSVIFDADEFREYLKDKEIKKVKIIMAHNLNYINKGNGGKYAGYNSSVLTFVIAGYDNQGNYIFHNGMAMDRGLPCPVFCPNMGTASNDLLMKTTK